MLSRFHMKFSKFSTQHDHGHTIHFCRQHNTAISKHYTFAIESIPIETAGKIYQTKLKIFCREWDWILLFSFSVYFFPSFFFNFFAFSTKLNLNERRKSFFIRWIYMAVASLSMLTFLVPAEKFFIYFLLLYISSGKMCRFSLIKKDRISFGNVIKNYFMVHSSRKLPKIQKHTTRDKEIFPPFHVQTKEIKSVKYFFAHWHRHTNR